MFNELINNFSVLSERFPRAYILMFTRAWLSFEISKYRYLDISKKPLSAPKQSRGKPKGVPTIWSSAY